MKFTVFRVFFCVIFISIHLTECMIWYRNAIEHPKISPEIISDLNDFTHLIPKSKVEEVVAKHLLIDGGFRKAMLYLESSAFDKLVDTIQDEPEIAEILTYLHLIPSTAEKQIEELHNYYMSPELTTNELAVAFNIVLLDELFQTKEENRFTVEGKLKTLPSFLNELLTHLPRVEYVKMIKDKCQKSTAFTAFYKALRSAQFKSMVEAAVKSKNLAKYMQILNSNDVDVNGVLPIVFDLISWGPNI